MVTLRAIANANSGRFCRLSDDECADAVRDFSRIARCPVRFTRDSQSADAALREEFLAADVLAVLGGDGTSGKAYAALHPLFRDFPHKAIASVPMGSGCAIRHEYSLPSDLSAAAFHLGRLADDMDAHRHALDLIRVNDADLAMFSSIGLGAQLIERYERSFLRGRTAVGGYLLALAQQCVPFAWHSPAIRSGDARSAMLLVSKFRHVGLGAELMPEAVHDDGLLHCRSYSKDDLLLLPRAYLGRPAGSYAAVRTLEVLADAPLPYEVNGDVRPARTEFRFEIVPHAVNVLRSSR